MALFFMEFGPADEIEAGVKTAVGAGTNAALGAGKILRITYEDSPASGPNPGDKSSGTGDLIAALDAAKARLIKLEQ